MFAENQRKLQLRRYLRAKTALHHHRVWFIYDGARELGEVFSLDELQSAIYRKAGIRPQKNRLLEEAHRFYEQYDISLINRVQPGSNSFTVNPNIDLDNPPYKAIIRPPQKRPGRPKKKYTEGEQQQDKTV